MKTAIILIAIAGLLVAGPVSAASLSAETPHVSNSTQIACNPIIEPVCFTYYWYCRNYIHDCPIL